MTSFMSPKEAHWSNTPPYQNRRTRIISPVETRLNRDVYGDLQMMDDEMKLGLTGEIFSLKTHIVEVNGFELYVGIEKLIR